MTCLPEPPEPDIVGFAPDFARVSDDTWTALRLAAQDPNLMERLFVTMMRTGRFDQAVAGPAIETELRMDPSHLALTDGVDVSDLSSLLVALLNASFELHVSSTFAAD